MIEYVTDIREDGKTTFVVNVNGKSVTVKYEEERKYRDRIYPPTYKYGNVTVYGDLELTASKAHLAEIVLALNVVKIIKENNHEH